MIWAWPRAVNRAVWTIGGIAKGRRSLYALGTTRLQGLPRLIARPRRCPGWPPGARLEGGRTGRGGWCGGSDDGGLEELEEFWPRRAVNSCTCPLRRSTSARKAANSVRKAVFSASRVAMVSAWAARSAQASPRVWGRRRNSVMTTVCGSLALGFYPPARVL